MCVRAIARLESSPNAPLQQTYRPGYVTVSPLTMHNSRNKTSGEKANPKQALLSFPSTRAVLWDRRPLGESIILHPTHYRNPSLVLEEKTLRLAHRFAEQHESDSYMCYFLASLSTDEEGQGLCVVADRFESNTKVALGQARDSIVIPCLMKKNSAKPKTTSEDYGEAIKSVCARCFSKSKLELHKLVSMAAYCSYHDNAKSFLFHVDFTIVTCAVRFKMTSVASVPIVPTALSKNLCGPKSLSEIQGEPKSGYLTMDQTRKLLLVLESDPKVDSLPLVGIWISGVSQMVHPFVWAACLRYVFNPNLKERVVTPPEAFLLVLFSPVRSRPEFYEIVTSDGSTKMNCDLTACHDVVQLPKDTLRGSGSPYEMELVKVEAGEKMQAFEAALENNKTMMSPPKMKAPEHSFAEDITPRTGPMPQIRKAADIQPSVPEVSLLMDENEANFAPRPVPRPIQMTHTNAFPEPNHSRRSKKRTSLPSAAPPNPMIPGQMYNNSGGAGMGPGYPQNSMANTNPAHNVYMSDGQRYPAMSQQPMYINTAAQYGNIGNMPPLSQPQPQQYPAMSSTYNPAMSYAHPHMYPSPVQTGPPMYAPQMYNMAALPGAWIPGGAPPVNQPIHDPHHAGHAQTHLSTARGPVASAQQAPAPAYSNQLPTYSQRFTAPTSNQHPNIAHQSTVNQNMHEIQHPVTNLGEMKSPVLRPVRDNSELEDTGEMSNATIAHQVSPQLVLHSSQNASPRQRPQQPQTASSSTDSGLHCSDNQDPELANNTLDNSSRGVAGNATLNATLGGIAANEQIQPQVLELLRMQDEQLKMLRDQLSQLLIKQQPSNADQRSLASAEVTCQSSEATLQGSQVSGAESKLYHDMATQMSNQATPIKQVPNAHEAKRSAAVNTSLFSNRSIEQGRGNPGTNNMIDDSTNMGLNFTHQDMSIQARHAEDFNSKAFENTFNSQQASTPSNNASTRQSNDVFPTTPSQQNSMTSQEVSPTSQLNSQDGGGVGGSGSCSGETVMSFGELQQIQIQDRTQSMVSDMMVDMPAFASLSPEKRSGSNYTDTDESNRSPLLGESVSMYERNAAMAEGWPDGADSQRTNTLLFKDHHQFYQNLMGNVQKLLGNSGASENSLLPPTPHRDQAAMLDFHGQPEHLGAAHPGMNRSQSLPNDMQDQAPRTEPLRQSYPQTDDVRRESAQSDDVAEKTRRQLAAMGIELDNLNEQEKSRVMEHSSIFLDPALLPRMQYVSMILDSSDDSDLSTEADALAMKYLSDEQLSELAKLRLAAGGSNPGKSRRSGLDRVLQSNSGRSTTNSTMYGANNMSFASRKYLERYGLLDSNNSSGADLSRDTPTPYKSKPEVNSRNDEPHWGVGQTDVKTGWDSTQGVKVKDFLNSLRERSFCDQNTSDNPAFETRRQDSFDDSGSRDNSQHSAQAAHQREHHVYNEQQKHGQAKPNYHQEYQNSPMHPTRKSAEHGIKQTPRDARHAERPIFNTSAPHIQHDNVVNVFDKVPHSEPRQKHTLGLRHNPRMREEPNNQVEKVLDIQRLRELPKLL